MAQSFDQDFAFFKELRVFYVQNRGKIQRRYKDLTRKFLAYNDPTENPGAFLRPPQFEALEMYVFIKEFLGNPQIFEIFDSWRNREGDFSDRSYYSLNKESAVLFDEFTKEQSDKLFKLMKNCLLYTSPSPRDISGSRMPSSA